ncbi:MAG TPA: S-adenosylmethionine:tRNA ribosyltransferase-isomerase, partial [Verrucomicrobiae bacterium]|nr:S-adenosylmethionine:tRNA ribosyltransferase-isomerase [Verrucomicrobiae bacterium]
SKKGINQAFLTLHVGLGTFAPLTEENLKDNQLHEEFFHMEESEWKKVVQAQKERRSIVAVGSTVTRVLESIYKNHPQDSLSGSTKIFIKPPFEFGVVSTLITNFHLPNSSLMCLVEAFLQHKKSKLNIKQLYKLAIKKKYRFYSFGDAMLIL